jgi:predicted nucleotidyltransferase
MIWSGDDYKGVATMASITDQLRKAQLLNGSPRFIENNVAYEVMSGSTSYGVDTENSSDIDVVGYVMPPVVDLYPHLTGAIPGFGVKPKPFTTYVKHHMDYNGKQYDLTLYSVVKFFQLCAENNPNMVDSLFVPERCVLHCTGAAAHVRAHRRLFLHKGAYHKFCGYAYSQLNKMRNKQPTSGKRKEAVDKYGYDVKFAYHLVRLIDEVEQILTLHDLDITRSREMLKSIRRGEWSMEMVEEHFQNYQSVLLKMYQESTLRYEPDYQSLLKLLTECIEIHYGAIHAAPVSDSDLMITINQIKTLVNKVK